MRAEIAARQKEENDRVLAASGPLDRDAAVEIAKRDDLTEEQARHFDSRLTDADRKALTGGKVSAPICSLWATSTAENLRRYAATNVENDSPLLAALAKDHDANVAAAAKKNPKYEKGFFEKLFS